MACLFHELRAVSTETRHELQTTPMLLAVTVLYVAAIWKPVLWRYHLRRVNRMQTHCLTAAGDVYAVMAEKAIVHKASNISAMVAICARVMAHWGQTRRFHSLEPRPPPRPNGQSQCILKN